MCTRIESWQVRTPRSEPGQRAPVGVSVTAAMKTRSGPGSQDWQRRNCRALIRRGATLRRSDAAGRAGLAQRIHRARRTASVRPCQRMPLRSHILLFSEPPHQPGGPRRSGALRGEVDHLVRTVRSADGHELPERSVHDAAQRQRRRLDCPAQRPDQCVDELHRGVVRDWLRVAHRVAHTTEVRGVTSEVEGGSGA